MFVMVAYRIAFESFVGPSQAATRRLLPCASSRLIASPATTGSSTSRPKAIINEAIDICWISKPSNCMKPNVMARVTGIEIAISSAERHSQIAQVQQRSVAGLANGRAIDVLQRSEFVGLLQFDAAAACVQRAGGDR